MELLDKIGCEYQVGKQSDVDWHVNYCEINQTIAHFADVGNLILVATLILSIKNQLSH